MYADIQNMAHFTARSQLMSRYGMIGDEEQVVVRTEFDVDVPGGVSNRTALGERSFHESAIRYNKLLESVRLMRLFTGSALDVPAQFWFAMDGSRYIPTMYGSGEPPLQGTPFSITSAELPALAALLNGARLPFGRAHLDQAVEIADLTARALRPSLAIATSTLALLALLGDEGDHEAWRMRIGPAALLAHDGAEYLTIREEMRRIYDLRCRALHVPDPAVGTWRDVESLRGLLSRSILAASHLAGEKDDLLRILEERATGYGDAIPTRPTRG